MKKFLTLFVAFVSPTFRKVILFSRIQRYKVGSPISRYAAASRIEYHFSFISSASKVFHLLSFAVR